MKKCPRCKMEKDEKLFGVKSFHKASRQGNHSIRVYCLRCKSVMDSEVQKLNRVFIKKLIDSECSLGIAYRLEKLLILNYKKGAM